MDVKVGLRVEDKIAGMVWYGLVVVAGRCNVYTYIFKS